MPSPYTSIQPYLVGKDQYSQFQTIQAGINAAHAAGASSSNILCVYVKPGVYTETLTPYDGVNVIGLGSSNGSEVTWTGVANAWSGTFRMTNMNISNTGSVNIFTLPASTYLIFTDCQLFSSQQVVYCNASSSAVNFSNCDGYAPINFDSSSVNCTIDINGGFLSLTSTCAGAITINASQAYLGSYITSTGSGKTDINLNSCSGMCIYDNSASSNSSNIITLNSCDFYQDFSINGSGTTININDCNLQNMSNPMFQDGTSSLYVLMENCCTPYTGNQLAILSNSVTNIYCTGCNLTGAAVPSLSNGATINYINSTPPAQASIGQSFVTQSTALVTTATDGFTYLPSCAGVPTGVPTSYGAAIPAIYDTTDSALYLYNGSWKLPPGTVNIAGNSGTATGSTITLTTGATNASGTALFTGSGSTVTLTATNANNNTIWGSTGGHSLTSGTFNVGLGDSSLFYTTSGVGNIGIGHAANQSTTGSFGIAIGYSAYSSGTSITGSGVIAIGNTAGSAYVGAESNNLVLSNGGVAAESNVIRIGTQGSGAGQQNKFFAAGIVSQSLVGASAIGVVAGTGQIGTGSLINALQPAFLAYPSNPTNVTGDGTVYTMAYTSTSYNQGSNYNTGTFNFTAPVTGIYHFDVNVSYSLGGSVPTSGVVALVTTSATYWIGESVSLAQSQAVTQFAGSATVPMTANDTAFVTFVMSGSTKAVGILGNSGVYRSIFSGYLVC